MIRHELILRLRSDANREVIDRTLKDVKELLAGIPGVIETRSGVNNAPSYRHALLVVFVENERALQRFSRHPLHARAVRLLSRLTESYTIASLPVGVQPKK
ncbi:MAG TPA: Dabb family protein [Ktedonobacterales bacterium]|nr:Dabb family protein [Ktedonobacterales bacterium]